MKTRFEPRLPRMSSWKSNTHNSLDFNSGPLASQVSICATGPSKLIHKSPTKLSILRSQLREQICQTSKSDRQEWQSLVVLNGTNIFLTGTYISFLKFICGILNRGVANSFWNHVIQILSRQMYFQDIYSNLRKVKVFSGNFYSLKSNTYFWGTVMFVLDGFLNLIVTRHKLTVYDPWLAKTIMWRLEIIKDNMKNRALWVALGRPPMASAVPGSQSMLHNP